MLVLLPHAWIHKLMVMNLTSASSSLIILARVSISSRSLLTSLRSASSSGRIFAISSFRSSFSLFCHPKKCELVIFRVYRVKVKERTGNRRTCLCSMACTSTRCAWRRKASGGSSSVLCRNLIGVVFILYTHQVLNLDGSTVRNLKDHLTVWVRPHFLFVLFFKNIQWHWNYGVCYAFYLYFFVI